jgi:hypothetical protein
MAHGPKSKKRRASRMRAASHAAQKVGYPSARKMVQMIEARPDGVVYPLEVSPFLLALAAGL